MNHYTFEEIKTGMEEQFSVTITEQMRMQVLLREFLKSLLLFQRAEVLFTQVVKSTADLLTLGTTAL